jgi:Rod binding domain-containing protein
MEANAIQGSLVKQQSPTDKLVHAAQQFEAILLNQLLGGLEHAFCSLGEKNKTAGSDQYQFLGLQSLASAVAAKGGLGIADMLIRHLKSPPLSQESTGTTQKPL